MKKNELEDGVKAILDEVLAVNTGEIAESGMTRPSELVDLVRVSTFGEVEARAPDRGVVLRFKDETEWWVAIRQSR